MSDGPASDVADSGPAVTPNGAAPTASAASGPTQPTAVAFALETGWTMALLSEPLHESHFKRLLPSEHELPVEQRIKVELTRLRALLVRLKDTMPSADPAVPVADWVANSGDYAGDGRAALVAQLEDLNVALLASFACVGREAGMGYTLGRSLRTTTEPPTGKPDDTMATRLRSEFEPGRVNKLQGWLRTLAPLLGDGAAVVSESLGWWAYLVQAAFDPATPGSVRWGERDRTAEALHRSLRDQGDVWLALLLGTAATADLLTPEGYARAGEIAVDRAARIAWRALLHFWPVPAVVLAALGGVSYLAFADLGTKVSKAFTEIAAVGVSLGITGQGLASTAGRLTKEGMGRVYESSKSDAAAWAITEPPRLSLTHGAVAALRRRGVPPGSRMGPVALARGKFRGEGQGTAAIGDVMSSTPYSAA